MKNLKFLGVLLVSFLVMGFNVFAETDAYVKIIRGEEEIEFKDLASVAEAFTKTEDGDEISILKDLDLTPLCVASKPAADKFGLYVPFADNVKLNLNGNTITTSPICIRYSGNNLTVKNGKFKVPNGSYGLYIGHEYTLTPSENIVLENLVIEGGLNVYHAKNVVLRNVKAIGTNYYAVWGDYYADIIIESGEFTGTGPGIIALTGAAKYNGEILNGTAASIKVEGGSFTATEKTKLVYMSSNPGKPVISGGTYNVDPKEYVKDGYKSILSEDKYVVSEIFEVLNHAGDNGELKFDKDFAVSGETVTMTITPNEGYEIGQVRIIDKDNNEIEVKDNKFTMPNSDVWVSVKFAPIQKAEVPVVNKDNTIGVSNVEKTEEVLLESLSKNDKYKNLTITVEVVVEDIKATEEVKEEFTKALEKDEIKTGKIVSYFDITVAVKNTQTKKVEGTLTELTEKIEFTVALPEIEAVKDGFIRKYYVIKKHDDKVEVINATLSKDGKHITFETNEFSTYALAYEDVEKEQLKDDNKTETPEDTKTENTEKVPQTFDGISTTLILATLSLISVVGIYLYFKRETENR